MLFRSVSQSRYAGAGAGVGGGIGAVVGGGLGLMSGLMAGDPAVNQIRQQQRLNELQIAGNKEYTATTYKLAKMNLAIRGIAANLGDVPADTFGKDQHPDLKALLT